MNNPRIILLIVLSVLLLLAVAIYQTRQGQKHFDWEEQWSKEAYNSKSDQPYGTGVLHRLLKTYFQEYTFRDIQTNVGKVLQEDSLLNSSRPCTYIFAGEALYLDSSSTARLLDLVARGNTAFIASKSIPFDLMFHVYYEECEGAEWDDYSMHYVQDSVGIRLKEPDSLKVAYVHYARQNQRQSYRWHHIGREFFCPGHGQRPLGYLEDSLINFASFPHGKGQFLLYTTPLALTNYALLRKETQAYVTGLLSHLTPSHIYWDAVSGVPEQVSRYRNQGNHRERLPEDHPLKYILKQPPLAWAWYLLLAMAVLWVIFGGKRRQSIVPVLAPKENTSWQFINTMANLHFRSRNYRGISREQMRLFLGWLREKYGLSVSLDAIGVPLTNASFLKDLAFMSGVPQEEIQSIFTLYVATIRYEPSQEMMIRLHRQMENFMKVAK